jgi:hypothetical protein
MIGLRLCRAGLFVVSSPHSEIVRAAGFAERISARIDRDLALRATTG